MSFWRNDNDVIIASCLRWFVQAHKFTKTHPSRIFEYLWVLFTHFSSLCGQVNRVASPQTQQTHDIMITSLLRRNDVATSFDVIMSLSSHHVFAGKWSVSGVWYFKIKLWNLMLKYPKSIYVLRCGNILNNTAFGVIINLMLRYAPEFTIITALSLRHVSTWIWRTETFIW